MTKLSPAGAETKAAAVEEEAPTTHPAAPGEDAESQKPSDEDIYEKQRRHEEALKEVRKAQDAGE